MLERLAISNVAKTAGRDDEHFKDIVMLYLSGHGAAWGSSAGADTYLITPSAPSYAKESDDDFAYFALNISEAVKPLVDSKAEVMVIIDSCRVYTNQKDTSVKFLDSLERTLPNAVLFIAAELGMETNAVSFQKFPRRYPELFKGVTIPADRGGNSIFNHAFLLSLYCYDTATTATKRSIMDPETINSFIYKYYQTDTEDMVKLLDALQLSSIRLPRFNGGSYRDTQYWLRQLDPNPTSEFGKCIKSGGF